MCGSPRYCERCGDYLANHYTPGHKRGCALPPDVRRAIYYGFPADGTGAAVMEAAEDAALEALGKDELRVRRLAKEAAERERPPVTFAPIVPTPVFASGVPAVTATVGNPPAQGIFMAGPWVELPAIVDLAPASWTLPTEG